MLTRNSTRLTDQHSSYTFSCSPFTIHVRHLLPRSKSDHSQNLVHYTLSKCLPLQKFHKQSSIKMQPPSFFLSDPANIQTNQPTKAKTQPSP